MSEDIRKDLLQSPVKGIEKFQEFHTQRFVEKSTPLRDTIHRTNLKTMTMVKEKPTKTVESVKKTMNMTDRELEVARD